MESPALHPTSLRASPWTQKRPEPGISISQTKAPPIARRRSDFKSSTNLYRVDSISNPQASSSPSGMYFEFLLRRAHSRSRVERRYWSGVSLNSFTTCSNDVTVGTTGPIGSGLPQFGFPRRFAIGCLILFPFIYFKPQDSPPDYVTYSA